MSPNADRWETRRRAALAAADAGLADEPLVATLLDEVISWLKALRDGGSRLRDRAVLTQVHPGSFSLPDRLRQSGLGDWAGRVESLAVESSPVTAPEPLMVERTIGLALGRLVGSEPTDASFDLAARLTELLHDADQPFRRSALEAAQGNPSAPAELAALLRRRVAEFTSAPRNAVYMIGGSSTCAMVEAFWRSGRLQDVWCAYPGVPQMMLRHGVAYQLLSRLESTLWLDVIEGFPSPEPVSVVVERCRPERDLDGLAHLIAKAASPFGDDLVWRRENKVVFHLLLAAERLLIRLAGSIENNGSAEGFDATLTRVCAAIATRPDAAALGHAWLEELAWKEYANREWSVPPDSAVPDALERVFMAVALATPAVPDPVRWIEAKEATWRGDRVLAVLAAAKACTAPAAMGDLLLTIATKDLAGSNERIVAHRSELTVAVTGEVVSRLPDPVEWLDQLWNKTYLLRDRARHTAGRRGDDVDANILCIGWGIAALESTAPGSPVAQALWARLEAMTREASLTSSGPAATSILAKARRRLAMVWNVTFPLRPAPGAAGSLPSLVEPFALPDREFMSLLLTLEANGVSLAEIRAVAGGRATLRAMTLSVIDEVRETEDAPALNLLEGFMLRL
ncbi:hypothetical protein ACYQR9_15355 [Methylobacterium sp. CM6241]